MRDQPPWEVVSFDFWRTLFDAPFEGGRARHVARVDAYHRALAASGTAPARRDISNVMMTEWGHFNRVHTIEHRTLSNEERVDWIAAQLDLEPPAEEVRERLLVDLEESIFAGPPVLLEGMVDLLGALAQRVRLAIISDTSFSTGRTLRRLLDGAGILEHFDVLTFSDEVGRSKPHSSVFEATLEPLGSPERVVHIGDREDTDVAGAKAMELDAVLFLAAVSEAKPDHAKATIADHVAWSTDELKGILL